MYIVYMETFLEIFLLALFLYSFLYWLFGPSEETLKRRQEERRKYLKEKHNIDS